MPAQQKQRLKEKTASGPKSDFRQSYDREQPIDAHSRKIDYVTASEVAKLVKAAKQSRHHERNALLILMLFRHGLRESEALLLRRDWLNLDNATIWIERLKRGRSSFHPIAGDELRLLRKYLRTRDDDLPWLFLTERMEPMKPRNVAVIVAQAAKVAKLRHINPHALRHGCGFYLHNEGHSSRMIQDYLGHVKPESTARYTRTSAKQFETIGW